MMRCVVAVVTMLAVVAEVRSQCFTKNDRFNLLQAKQDLPEVTQFGMNLFRQLDSPSPCSSPSCSSFPSPPSNSNLFFSPYSIWSALVLAYFGSGGKTEVELREALGVDNKLDTLRDLRALDLTYELRGMTSHQYTFRLANRLYVSQDAPVRDCIKEILSREFEQLDFKNTAVAAGTINQYVSNVTEGTIPELVQDSDLLDAGMVLANAAFFRGMWKNQFSPEDSFRGAFKSADGAEEEVEMMKLTARLRFGISKELGAKVLELPYEGDAVSMIILQPLPQQGPPTNVRVAEKDTSLQEQETNREPLSFFDQTPMTFEDPQTLSLDTTQETQSHTQSPTPTPASPSGEPLQDSGRALNDIIARLTPEALTLALNNTRDTEVKVTLPKFNMSTTLKQELEPAFRALGINDLFDPVYANMSTFISKFSPPLSVGKSVHKAFVEVSEEGTVAGAATALTIVFRTKPVQFKCDSPFLFLIHDNDTKNVFFMGAFRHPPRE